MDRNGAPRQTGEPGQRRVAHPRSRHPRSGSRPNGFRHEKMLLVLVSCFELGAAGSDAGDDQTASKTRRPPGGQSESAPYSGGDAGRVPHHLGLWRWWRWWRRRIRAARTLPVGAREDPGLPGLRAARRPGRVGRAARPGGGHRHARFRHLPVSPAAHRKDDHGRTPRRCKERDGQEVLARHRGRERPRRETALPVPRPGARRRVGRQARGLRDSPRNGIRRAVQPPFHWRASRTTTPATRPWPGTCSTGEPPTANPSTS